MTAELLAALATAYGVGGALSVLLQARQMHARGSSADVSVRFLGIYVGGYAVWLLYGLSIASVPVVVVHALGLATGAAVVQVIGRTATLYRRNPEITGKTGDPPPWKR